MTIINADKAALLSVYGLIQSLNDSDDIANNFTEDLENILYIIKSVVDVALEDVSEEDKARAIKVVKEKLKNG